MTQSPMPDQLRDVLDAYLASTPQPDRTNLAEWIRRYPEYEQELTEFTVSWSLTETLPPTQLVQDMAAEELLDRGRAVVRRVLSGETAPRLAALTSSIAEAAEREYAHPVASIAGLEAEARAGGLSAQHVANTVGFSLALLLRLDRGLIRFSTIPHEAIEALATAIGREPSAVAHYLQGIPAAAQGTSSYTEATPALPEPGDFFEAIRDDPNMGEADRARWLALEPPAR